ncbi:hypothetical protein [Caulobacter sp.]|uniref:hypothetical protein n=1 Tax=Caulobacter sp. TaxID=78 RepID=UPI0025BB1075|nr:hypothetical protein [Caulobacter sp.]
MQTLENLKAGAPFSEARGPVIGAMDWVRRGVAADIACQEQRSLRWFLSLHIRNAEEKFRHRRCYAESTGVNSVTLNVQYLLYK